LWFTKFEFNASIYYVLRWIGFQWKGYNLIAQIGPALSLITALSIFYLSYRVWTQKSNIYQAMMGSILIYLLCATTVHPWYWTTVLALSILTQSRIGLLGSMLVFLSYTAYGEELVQESWLWLSLEYLLLFAYLFWELKNSKAQKDQWAKTSSS
ncbi:MAG: mannosyltransferase, partial [Bacteroidetes bacterium]|nr:mannosyltransferase [Bacteroidota bacterium]